jgi:exosortase
MIVIATVLTCVLFWHAFQFAWNKWDTDPNYGHAYFVPPAAAYLAWRKRDALRSQEQKPSPAGIALVAPAIALHAMASNAGLLRFSMVAFVMVLAGETVVFCGWGTVRHLVVPLVLLLFAVPIPLYLESATLPMKLVASAMSTGLLKVLGLSVYREGTIIHLPNMTLEVATACSGLRSLVLVTTVGAFYGYVSQQTNVRRIIIFASSIPIAVCANIARIVATAVLSNSVDSEVAHKLIHDFSGIFVFVVAGALFVVTGMALDAAANSRLFRGGKEVPKEAVKDSAA